MKKNIFVLAALLFIWSASFGQYVPKGKVAKADMALAQGKLDIAKAEIDLAFEVDEKGKVTTTARNWGSRAEIYKAIYLDSGEYAGLDDKALEKCAESYNKMFSLMKPNDPMRILEEQKLNNLYSIIMNNGAEAYNNDDLKGAADYFDQALVLNPNDTTALLYAGQMYQNLEQYDQTIEYFQRLADMGYNEPQIYKSLSFFYRVEVKDTVKAISSLERGLEVLPENAELKQEQIILLITTNQADKAESVLKEEIAATPESETLYFYLGYLYEKQGKEDQAFEQYKKSVEVNPGYYEGNFNAGVIYYNKANEVMKELNNLPMKEFDKNEEEYTNRAAEYYKIALPYFENAYQAKPDDVDVIETLEAVYIRLKMNDKAQKLEDKLKQMGAH